MATITRKYYVMVPEAFSHSGEAYWLELRDVKTLTEAQSRVDLTLAGIPEAEIGVSINGGNKTVISIKNGQGKWKVVYEGKRND